MSAAGLIAAAEIWLAIGAVVALAFLFVGLDRVEPNARGGYVFRVLIAPGLCLLWPIVLWRWRLIASNREDWHNRHSPQRGAIGWMGFGMAAVIVLILLTALLVRPVQDLPPPQKIGSIERVSTS
ncbi:hypothetical protein [Hwanghaeella sp.]|uniref:hypothetical protein n=1 Tax=Hwanghaeella sp. TaxID=2605943 RepID=UPI003CCC21ED